MIQHLHHDDYFTTKLLLFHWSEETGDGLRLGFNLFQSAVRQRFEYRLFFFRADKLLVRNNPGNFFNSAPGVVTAAQFAKLVSYLGVLIVLVVLER